MATFKDLKSLMDYVEMQIMDTLLDEVEEEVYKVQKRKIDDEVYSVYNPVSHNRAKDGVKEGRKGLQHRDNLMGVQVGTKGKPAVLFQNITRGRHGYYIAGVIEYGDNSSYGNYEFPISGKDPRRHTYLNPRPCQS